MLRKRLNLAITLALLVAVVATFLTGWIASALDLNRFAYHIYAAYLTVALAAAHVYQHRRTLAGQVRRWVLGERAAAARAAAPAEAGRRSSRPSECRLTRRALVSPTVLLGLGAGLGYFGGRGASARTLSEGEDLGLAYHRWSTPSYTGLLSRSIHIAPRPEPYKAFPGAPSVELPRVEAPAGAPIEQVIARRRSVREYADRHVTLAELSRLLQDANGITDERDPTLAFRAAPSSGALYPVEVYPVIFSVDGVAPGVYHYDVRAHRLTLLRPGDFREEMFQAAVAQEMLLRCDLVLVLTGLWPRVQWKYVERSYRYILLEAGHVGQNVYLAATALGLGPCGIGAFFDDQVNRLLGLDEREEQSVYLLALGAARSG
ncbi:MAG: SagB/ThcOx family dehydrogenase [Chloroflexota bacterium]|nr:SagB/ThcOx family dehydrogenase [Chloroflexota bacterium]